MVLWKLAQRGYPIWHKIGASWLLDPSGEAPNLSGGTGEWESSEQLTAGLLDLSRRHVWIFQDAKELNGGKV